MVMVCASSPLPYFVVVVVAEDSFAYLFPKYLISYGSNSISSLRPTLLQPSKKNCTFSYGDMIMFEFFIKVEVT